jgi:membrane-associated protease RseP (regulator of RpoE activity)
MRRIFNFLIGSIVVLFLAGCATITGPYVSREEIRQAREELKVKALEFQIKQLQRVNEIGNRIILAVEERDIKGKPQPFLGLVAVKADKYLKKVYDLESNKGVVIIIVKEGSSAANAGLKPGDEIVSINNRKIRDIYQFKRAVSKFKIGDFIKIEGLRKRAPVLFNVNIGRTPINIPIVMVDKQEVNAATDGKTIYITNGLLYFIKSDDEIAAVISHELAHAVRGHVVKMQGTQVLGALAALVLGTVAETASPGSGEVVVNSVGYMSNIFTAGYSRDIEREADYFSVKFMYNAGYDADISATLHERFAIEIPGSMIESYLSTHPSSPERVLRIRKTIEEFKSGESKVLNNKDAG